MNQKRPWLVSLTCPDGRHYDFRLNLNFTVASFEVESGTERTFWDFHDRIIEEFPAALAARMSEYRVYVIGIDGLLKAIHLDCQDDSAAIESAKQFIDGHDIELWQRDRRIARFDIRLKDTNGWLKDGLKPPE